MAQNPQKSQESECIWNRKRGLVIIAYNPTFCLGGKRAHGWNHGAGPGQTGGTHTSPCHVLPPSGSNASHLRLHFDILCKKFSEPSKCLFYHFFLSFSFCALKAYPTSSVRTQYKQKKFFLLLKIIEFWYFFPTRIYIHIKSDKLEAKKKKPFRCHSKFHSSEPCSFSYSKICDTLLMTLQLRKTLTQTNGIVEVGSR